MTNNQQNLSLAQQPDWAMFLPAISSFYISGLGQQRTGVQYFEPSRLPAQIQDTEQLNFLNSQRGLYHYRWGLYSAGHANLDTTVTDPHEDLIRNRESGTFLLGDSGGFQISKGVWPANWSDANCPRAQSKRAAVLNWMDTYMDYGMVLDIPTTTLSRPDVMSRVGIHSYADAVRATQINNEYFINNRTGRCRFLNVLQGTTHAEAEDWYQTMRDYCDPRKYPERHFNGWAAGGRNKLDVHLLLKRLVNIIYDDLLQPGRHDWIHYLGISWLEYALLYSDVQRAIRRHHNPELTISFDCASPFYGAAKGQCYYQNRMVPDQKWSYKMGSTAENKRFAGDTRPFAQAVVQEGIHPSFTDSPVSARMTLGDLCYRGVNYVNKHGKSTKTSWDTLSYVLLQGHNTYMHITAVQEANRRYDAGTRPAMLQDQRFDRVLVRDVIEGVFAAPSREASLKIIEDYTWLWNRFHRGADARTHFSQLFDEAADTDTADAEDQAAFDINPRLGETDE